MSSSIWDALWIRKKTLDIHPELIRKIIQFSSGKKILEIGFGTAGDLYCLKKLGYTTFGIDTSVIAVSRAKHFIGGEKIILGSGQNLPFEKNSFNLIFHQGLLEHFKNPKSFLLEQRRVLTSDGVLVIDVPHSLNPYTFYRLFFQTFGKWYGGWERSYTAKDLSTILEKCGYKVIDVSYRGIWPHQWRKFLYPESIVGNVLAKKILKSILFSTIQRYCKAAYDSSSFIKIISAHNLVIVAKRQPLRIALDAKPMKMSTGGVRTYAEALKDYIVSEGDIPCLLLPSDCKSKQHKEKNTLNSLINQWLWEQYYLPRQLKFQKADLYHAIDNMGVPFLSSSPTICTIHDLIPIVDKDYFRKSKFAFISKVNYLVKILISLFRSKYVITTNKTNKATILTYFPFINSDKIFINSMGVRNQFFIKKKLTKKKGINKIFYFGGIAERKNLDVLFLSLRYLKDASLANWCLDIIEGDFAATNDLKIKIQELGLSEKIKWHKYEKLEQFVQLISDCDVVVYTSKMEGFGLPVLEALAAMKPIVCSDLPSIREFAGKVPFYFDPNNYLDLAEKLTIASTTPNFTRVKMGRLVAKNYLWQKVLRSTYQIYMKTLAR